jgi:amino acid adenylation domain-containing protein
MSNITQHDTVTTAEQDREFWRRTLLAAAFTGIPRWTREPVAGLPAGAQPSPDIGAKVGVGEHVTRIPDRLVAALDWLAYEQGVSFSSVLLTAHAKVLGALSGERDVSTGYVASDRRPPLLFRMTTAARSWRRMLQDTHRAELELLSHANFPVEDLKRELGLTKPLFETVFDRAAYGPGELAEHTVLRVGMVERDGVVLKLRYRTDVLDASYAARIAGYHLTALRLIAADLDAEHEHQSLLSPGELRFQLHALSGPPTTLPDRRVHELFEEQVRAHADAIAAVQGDRQWTYRQLNARANRLARALLAKGLCREGVVAVVTERNLEWMAAVLAIFKAGGAYLPIEPHFPPDRIARMLSRAECRLVLTEQGSTTTLDYALELLSGVQTLDIDAACNADAADSDVGIRIASDQLAYIYFTSGSTGEPKGVMCEHAGMLNHLSAKIHDLGIGEGDVVAQTAPQCFDISLWQLVSALLVGGRTLLVDQETILDAKRFIDRIVDGKAAIVQVVPSYLEVLLSYLTQHPRELPHLRCVSVTGEALKKEIVQRWFSAQPGIRLVNAYGLTETSDDTNHEVMDSVPDGARVPLGRPINNVYVYVVDEHLSLVPLGAPGELVFSGVCVGRGYINDPERTRRAFMPDPFREGQRVYRSGDYGRWLPDRKLEFLGRRDTQVKISGFRIEIGEIENRLLRLPGVRDAAVVVTEGADRTKRLVAFCSGEQPLDPNVLRNQLSESLPDYMVPSAFHWRRSLALTDNGKIDRKALTALAGELDVAAQEEDAPSTATEQWLAAAWAEVLAIPKDQIGRRDRFFDLGGTSLTALRLAIALDRAVSFKDLTDHPMLADLATLVDERSLRQAQGRAGQRLQAPSEPLPSLSSSD